MLYHYNRPTCKTWELNKVLPPSKNNPPLLLKNLHICTVAVSKASTSNCYLVSKNATTDERNDARGIT
jgi:hypothetical protein